MEAVKLDNGEILKQVEGYYPYFISNEGNIYAEKKRTKAGKIVKIEYRPIKPGLNPSGYYYANLYAENKLGRSSLRLHRLVWQYHNPAGDCFKEGFIIDHIDECKTNNHIDNLQQITSSQNSKKYWAHKRKQNAQN